MLQAKIGYRLQALACEHLFNDRREVLRGKAAID